MILSNKIERFIQTIAGEVYRLNNPAEITNASRPRQALEQWVSHLKVLPETKGKVLISSLRNNTWIEWAAYAACVIRQMGYTSTLIYKGSEVASLYKAPAYFNFWTGVKKIPGIDLVDIEELDYDESVFKSYYSSDDKMLNAALAYDYKVEADDIKNNHEEFKYELERFKTEASSSAARLEKFLTTNKFYQFILYSGIIGDTSFLLSAAQKQQQKTVCVEGWGWREGHMIYNFNEPAVEYNIQGWLKYFGKWNKKKEAEMKEYFGFLEGQEAKGEWLKSFYSVQMAKIDSEIPEHILEFLRKEGNTYLLACNVIGDSSLLNRETIFLSHKEFIKETIAYFKQHKEHKLIIRVHPGEEWVKGKVKIKLGEFSTNESKGLENVLVINSDEKLNTFTLIPYLNAGLVWLTSAGADLVARGVPVIAAAKPKYHGLGIVEEPRTKKEYFGLLDEYTSEKLTPSNQQVVKAMEYLYVVFKGFSFEAQGRSFRAMTCKFNNMPSQEEHDRFYRILLEEDKAPDTF
jgi:hypothetical protein